MTKNNIDSTMERAVTDGVFPDAELLVATAGDIVHHRHYGSARPGLCFDIASLTKPIATATLTMMFLAEELLKLDDTVYQWLAGARKPWHREMTVAMLLNHTAGLPAWKPYYRTLPLSLVGTEGGKQLILEACLTEETISVPGAKTLYSDIGYIMLGRILEEVGSGSLDLLFLQRIAQPLHLNDIFFRRVMGSPLTASAKRTSTTAAQHVPIPHDVDSTAEKPARGGEQRRFAPTEDCPWRQRVLHGEVHDQNAYALGGVAGHAGLFATGLDLHRFLTTFTGCYWGTNDWIPTATVRRLIDFTPVTSGSGERFLGGWNLPAKKNSAAGHHFSSHSIGHLGYTGCSLWIDLDAKTWIILLTNRIHPSTTNEKIKTFRPQIHDVVMKTLIL